MGFGGFVTFVVVGVVVGWLAGVAMREGGSGLTWDLMLGIGGSGMANVIGWVAGLTDGVGAPTMVLVGAIGATLLIVGQRKLWPAPPPDIPRRVRMATRL